MQNISVVKSIFFIDRATNVSVPFISHSASYSCTMSNKAQGELYEHEISFKVAGINPDNEAMLSSLKRTPILHVDDVNRIRLTISRGDLRFKFTIKQDISGSAGGFRGYDVTIKLAAAHPPVSSPL